MSNSTDPSLPHPALNEKAGSKLLAKFADTDALFARPTIAIAPDRRGIIPLQRYQELEQSIRNSPATPEPYLELGRIYIAQERWADAKRVLEAGVQSSADYEPLLVLREDLLLQQAQQMLEQAKTTFAQAPSEENKYALEQADVNCANERIRVCRDRYNRHPEKKEILINWAIALRQLARLEEAIELLNHAAESPDLRSRSHLQLGMCYQTLNRPLDALSSFRKAALYRSPPPEIRIQRRALELALDLAEELVLIDSAMYYATHLLDVCDQSHRSALQKRLSHLQTLHK